MEGGGESGAGEVLDSLVGYVRVWGERLALRGVRGEVIGGSVGLAAEGLKPGDGHEDRHGRGKRFTFVRIYVLRKGKINRATGMGLDTLQVRDELVLKYWVANCQGRVRAKALRQGVRGRVCRHGGTHAQKEEKSQVGSSREWKLGGMESGHWY